MPILDTVLATVQAEFSDLFDAEQFTRVALRMTVALALGAAIGWDRERRDAEAGLRTHMLVALGAALFILVPGEAGMSSDGLSRVAQGVDQHEDRGEQRGALAAHARCNAHRGGGPDARRRRQPMDASLAVVLQHSAGAQEADAGNVLAALRRLKRRIHELPSADD